ncbi:MAG TPA: THUMP domain-containing protein [Pseudobdellovibrionaceae bacterium]|nr:THUMP domain-containing protein [Pseudobdellovibrionaceae bacterium]
MAQYFALTSRGLVDAVRDELAEMGAKRLEKQPGGVYFEGNRAMLYRANLRLRTATRVVRPISYFPAYKNEDLYHNVRKFDFTTLIRANQTVAVEASVRECAQTDQRFVAMKVKDAIVDQFREKYGERPSVDSKLPDLLVVIRGFKNTYWMSLDTSGEALFKRGYRKVAVEAPIKEHVGAGLLRLAEWDGETPIVDPMCGSGTILIEAALRAKGVSPGLLRKRFGFMNWDDFDSETWQREVDAAVEIEESTSAALAKRRGEEAGPMFFGFDLDRDAIKAAQRNAREAGVEDLVSFRTHAMETLEPPVEKGWIITNPPYGERLGNRESAKDIYRDLAFTLKNRFKGWSAFVLSADSELSAAMKLKATRKSPVWNGNIECRLLRYDLY